jgi:hypothetical protein
MHVYHAGAAVTGTHWYLDGRALVVIIPLTVREILDEHLAAKLA